MKLTEQEVKRIKELEEKSQTFHKIPGCDGEKAGLSYKEWMELLDLKKKEVE